VAGFATVIEICSTPSRTVYQRFFNCTEAQDPVGSATLGGFITLTDNDVDDIVAYLKLLGPNRIEK
jgi:hypothetical protein